VQRPYDPKKLTTQTTFSLPYGEQLGDGYWGFHGPDGSTYRISADQQRVDAYTAGKWKWTVRAVEVCLRDGATSRAAFTRRSGQPLIRHVQVTGNEMWLVVGKHDYCRIDLRTGKADCTMAD
jgi:hypothetical protein